MSTFFSSGQTPLKSFILTTSLCLSQEETLDLDAVQCQPLGQGRPGCVLSGPVTTGLDEAGKAKGSCPEAERLSLQA